MCLAASRRASFLMSIPSALQELHRCEIRSRATWCVTSQLTESRSTMASATACITTGSAETVPACCLQTDIGVFICRILATIAEVGMLGAAMDSAGSDKYGAPVITLTETSNRRVNKIQQENNATPVAQLPVNRFLPIHS
jgi:hypothetical protein